MKGFEFYPGPYRGPFGWMTNDGLALIGVGFAAKDHPAIRADIEGNYLRAIAEDVPELAERMKQGRREDTSIARRVVNDFMATRCGGPGLGSAGPIAVERT